jgi:hypothetical protein
MVAQEFLKRQQAIDTTLATVDFAGQDIQPPHNTS